MGDERRDDAVDNIAMSAGPASNVKVRLGIEWPPLVGQPAKRFSAIRGPEERTRVAAACPVGQHLDRRIEPDGDRAFVEDSAGAGIDERPAAGRDDSNLSFDQASDQAPLAVAKIGFAVALEHFGGRKTGGILDFGIAVDKGQAEPPGETPADGRFAGAHQADEDDRAVEAGCQLFHARGYTAGRKVGQKPIPLSQAREPDAASDSVPDCTDTAAGRRCIPVVEPGARSPDRAYRNRCHQ